MKSFLAKFQTPIIISGIIILTLILDRLVLLLNKIPYLSISGLASLSDKILFATFLALIWYAWETRKMRKEMVVQNELEQKPIVDLFYRPKTTKHDEYLRLRNSGKGVAYNINVQTITIENKKFKFYLDDPNLILTPLGNEQTLHVDAWNNKSHLGEGQLHFLKNTISPQTIYSKNDLKKIRFIIFYENANKKKYQRIFEFYCTTPATDDFKVNFVNENNL